ncbi:acetate--CoA ligase [Candidatus Poribacteria bacterium]|nr:acetate--CoA ligase [Candidatus Poribacteria bacterium]
MKNIIWKPYGDYKTKSNIKRFMRKHKIKDYDELIKKSIADTEWFWDAALKDLGVEWYEPYTKVLDASAGFPWAKWFIGGKMNIVHNCLDRHALGWRRNKLAVIWEADDGSVRTVSYWQLYNEVNRLANALKSLGIKKGDAVGIYMPMVPEIVTVLMGCLKIGAVAIPVFSGFGATALATRLGDAEAKVLFTADGSARRGKLVQIKREADKAVAMTPSIKSVVVLKRMGVDIDFKEGRDIWWHDLVPKQSSQCETEKLDAEDYSLIIYTSGTTGKPKGTVHTHAGCMAQMAKELGYYFDVKEEDTFFWVTDIGWMMGPWEIIGVQNFGGTYLIFEGAPDYPQPDRLWDVCERHGVTILGISPTAIRLLMRSGVDWVKKHDLSKIRILGSTGEPWDPESYQWFFEHVGGKRCPIINISGGTEIVGCLMAPLPIASLKPCTLRGPGLAMDIDVYDEDGKPIRGGIGHLVCKKPAPSMTKGFLKDPDRYISTYFSRWPNIWYHGDWAHVDEDGYWFLHGRADDTIKVSGRRTGPAEIEAALIEHPAVSEAAAIGVPHEIKGEGVVCFVVLHPAHQPSEELRNELKEQVVKIMGKTLRPEDLRFVTALPKTRSAKIVRGVIRKKWLGQDVGDIASVENTDAIEEIARAK